MSRTEERKPKRRVRIKYRRAAIFLSLLILVAFVAVTALLAAAGKGSSYDRSLLKGIGDPGAEAPELRAQSAALYSLDLDRMVYEKNSDYMLAPYSITKILTCYLALENLDPEQEVTVSKNACEELETSGKELSCTLFVNGCEGFVVQSFAFIDLELRSGFTVIGDIISEETAAH